MHESLSKITIIPMEDCFGVAKKNEKVKFLSLLSICKFLSFRETKLQNRK